ncbi:Peptidoglycan-binding lysin domain-containing protein [Cyclobacterium amurskyense]|uniref:Peptidoglycan-binding lysin domain-containing protein n=2 Tax=Cyclobacterium amurskyense TaxID=320787 RepID=A0A0H4PQ17_9BACT|nr:Peptidoglycan-binding lysin domain-containing protein [Cyclobacterium amurskyense]|tara:strand:- start:21569 stop:22768 length:1200 start_codon:yes stop_codon:yes gene_type:complete
MIIRNLLLKTDSKMKCWILIIGMIGLAVPSKGALLVDRDSVGVEKIGGKSYIIHQVDPQETLFGISRRYNTPVNEIVQNNDTLKDGLKIGQRIRVPYIEKQAIPEGAKVHHVTPGETLFSIAKSYNISMEKLMEANALKGTDLSVGQALIIEGIEQLEAPVVEKKVEKPVEATPQTVAVAAEKINTKKKQPKEKVEKVKTEEAPAPVPASPSTAPTSPSVSTTGNWISHQVVQGETLFAIARKYEANVEDIIKWNGLSSNNLSVGQTLKVGRETNANIPVTQLPGNNKPSAELTNSESATPPTKNISTSTAFKNVTESGQAEVIEGTGNHKKFLVLHRNAPVGTIMRVRNEENDVTVFARVVGVLPETGDNNKLLIKLSKAAFDQLKAVNSRFRVEVSY